jgi:CDGSH-type Zn-finger protein
VGVAHSCPSGAITYERRDGGPQEQPPAVNVLRVRENGPYALHADMDIEGQGGTYRATLCRCGKSKRKPFCDNSHRAADFSASGETATIESDPLEERGGPLKVSPTTNGPLQLNGSVEICTGTGRTIMRTENARLCRCGASATKPFCDGSHLTVGFRSDR